MTTMFGISSQGKSAASRIDELVYKHLCCAEGVSLSVIPIFHLEPNTLIYAKSENCEIDGDYIVNQFTVPLAFGGTMSITASKVIKQLK
jgi:hypothetical protein